MFPNITYWALKLIRLTEASHSMFFDPKFLSYSYSCEFGASSFDLNFRGFHQPVTTPRLHFKLLQFSLKIKYLGTLKYDFRK